MIGFDMAQPVVPTLSNNLNGVSGFNQFEVDHFRLSLFVYNNNQMGILGIKRRSSVRANSPALPNVKAAIPNGRLMKIRGEM